MKLKITLVAMVTLMASIVTQVRAETTSYEDKLSILRIVSYAQTILPVKDQSGISLESLAYDINNNVLTMYTLVPEHRFDKMFQTYNVTKQEQVVNLLPMLQNLGLSNDAMVGISATYASPSGRHFIVEFTEQDVRDVLAAIEAGSVTKPKFLEKFKKEISGLTFPVQMSEMSSVRNIVVGTDRVIFEVEVPREFFLTMDDPKNEAQVRANMIERNRKTFQNFRDDIVKDNILIIYQYYLPGESQSSLSVAIRPVELFP